MACLSMPEICYPCSRSDLLPMSPIRTHKHLTAFSSRAKKWRVSRPNWPPDASRSSKRRHRDSNQSRRVHRVDRATGSILEWQKLRCYTGEMTNTSCPLAHLSDDELLVEVRRLAEHERQATAQLIRSLAEIDTRRLYLGQGCSSLFTSARRSFASPSTPPTDGSRALALRGAFRSSWSCWRTGRST
jgi:hypothetical protein